MSEMYSQGFMFEERFRAGVKFFIGFVLHFLRLNVPRNTTTNVVIKRKRLSTHSRRTYHNPTTDVIHEVSVEWHEMALHFTHVVADSPTFLSHTKGNKHKKNCFISETFRKTAVVVGVAALNLNKPRRQRQ